MKALLSQKTLTINSGTKIFGYAHYPNTTLTDYTTSGNLTKTGKEWIEFIESITAWQSDSYAESGTELTVFKEDSFIPNRFKIYNTSLASLLGFIKDQLYSAVGGEISSTYWGGYKLVLSGIKKDSKTSILTKCEIKPTRKADSVFLTGFGSVNDYYKDYDNLIYTLESRMIHISEFENVRLFFNQNITNNLGETVLPVGIPKLLATSKTKKIGRLESSFIDDDSKMPDFCKFSCIVVEV